MGQDRFSNIPAFNDDSDEVNVIVDTPKGSRNKYSYDEELDVFELGGVLTAGHVFPYNFGFIPNTLGGDGDPVDVLVISDEPAFCGCLVKTRLIGVIEAEQKELDGEVERNDRLLGVAVNSPTHKEVRSIDDLDETLLDQLEHFFVSYNEAKGKRFDPLRRAGPDRALELVREGIAEAKSAAKS
jgi:inorganic pyrophosphatase